MGKTIQIKRGPKNTMPTLAQGELGMTTDSGAEGLFIGTGTKNIEMARKSDLNISGQISTHNSNSSAHSDIRKSVTTHTGNTSIHVTAEEKNAWNAKLDSYTETDPTVPAWAKAKSKPSYTASEVGAVPTSRKVNGKALSSDITLSASDVGARPSSWTPSASDVGAVPTSRKVNGKALSSDITLSASDVGLGNVGNFKAVSTVASQGLTDTEKSNARANIGAGTSSLTIGTTASTAAAGNHTHTAANVGAVPTSRKVNGKALSADITLSASDVSARPSSWTPSASDVGAVPTSRKVNGKALSSDITLSASDVGLGNVGNFKAVSTVASQGLTDTEKSNARANIGAGTSSLTIGTTASTAAAGNHTHTAANVGAVPTSRTVNGKALSTDITLSSSDVGAAPASHTSDSTIHVTTEEKATWNAKADAPFKPAGKSYLTFSSPNSFTLKVNDTTKHWDGTLEYFASDKTWTVWDGTTTISAVDNDGEYVLYLRGTGNTVITGDNNNYRWVLTGSDIVCDGNIENLLDYATVKSGAHPTMASKCYEKMFFMCTALTQAPELPATTLADYCYLGMFNGCTSLTQAPALPATTLVNSCYENMFYQCTSLTQAPALPATTLAKYCYNSMFSGCTRLTQAPILPATTLATSCYQSMFQKCTALTQAPALPVTALANSCYRSMFSKCTSLTQAPALPAITLTTQCYSNMFNGCTRLTQAPALPATTLATGCYSGMFYQCTSLTQAPALPATTLAEGCYNSMFNGCTALKLSSSKTDEYTQEYHIPSSGTGTTATNALGDMFTGTGGTFTGTPEINTTYYLSSDNMVGRKTEIATLNGYVDSMINAAHSYGTEDLEAGTSSLETGKLYFVYE